MSSFLISSVRNGAIFRDRGVFLERINPLLKLVVTSLYIVASMFLWLNELIYITLISISLTILTARKIELIYGLRLILIIAIISALFVGLFYPLERTIIVFLRIIVIGIWVIKFVVTTNPDDLSRELEKRGVPARFALILPLSMKLIPEIAKDAEETLISTYFREKTISNPLNPKKYITPLTLLLASTLSKSRYITEALASKAALRGRKSFYTPNRASKMANIIYLVASLTLLALAYIFPSIFQIP